MIGLLRRWFELHRDIEEQLRMDMEMLKVALAQISSLEDQVEALEEEKQERETISLQVLLSQQRFSYEVLLEWRRSFDEEGDWLPYVDEMLESFKDSMALISEHTE